MADALPPEAEDELSERQSYYLAQVRALKERAGRGLPLAPLRVGGQKVQLTEAQIQGAVGARFIEQACTGLGNYLGRVKALTGGRLPPVLLVGGSARLVGLKEAIEDRLGCRALRWERSEFATVLGGVSAAPAPPVPDRCDPSTAVAPGTIKEELVVTGGALGTQTLGGAGVQALAELPSLDTLRARLVGTIQTPAARIAGVLTVRCGQVTWVLAIPGSPEPR